MCIEGTAVGTFVDVVEPGTPHPYNGLPSWLCRVHAACKVTLVDNRTNRTIRHGMVQAGGMVQFLDKELQPIRPLPPLRAIPAPPVPVEVPA